MKLFRWFIGEKQPVDKVEEEVSRIYNYLQANFSLQETDEVVMALFKRHEREVISSLKAFEKSKDKIERFYHKN